MKFDQLAYFVEAARLESVGGASRSLGVSASAISHSIASLETDLGQALFVRERQRIYLTTHGRVLMTRASQILRDMERLREDLGSPELLFEGNYRIAVTRGLVRWGAADSWARFHALHPKLSVEFSTLRSIEIVAKALANELDVGICFDPSANPALDFRTIGTDQYCIVVRKSHAMAALSSREIVRHLSRYPACMHKSSGGPESYDMPPILKHLGVRPRVDFIYDNYDAVMPRITHSDAWAMIPAGLLRNDARDLIVLAIDKWHAPISIVAVWPRYKGLSLALSQFLEDMANTWRSGSIVAKRTTFSSI